VVSSNEPAPILALLIIGDNRSNVATAKDTRRNTGISLIWFPFNGFTSLVTFLVIMVELFANRVTFVVVSIFELFILEHDSCTFNEIIEYTKKAPSTISWHLKRLKDAGIISVLYNTSRCQQRLYKVRDFESLANVLSKYKESFADKIVNNYTEII
jgi:DNA-binding transcriptional ArsR family regulator